MKRPRSDSTDPSTDTKYMLRSIDISLWLDVKARVASEGRSVRFVLIELLKIYAKHGFVVVETFRDRDVAHKMQGSDQS